VGSHDEYAGPAEPSENRSGRALIGASVRSGESARPGLVSWRGRDHAPPWPLSCDERPSPDQHGQPGGRCSFASGRTLMPCQPLHASDGRCHQAQPSGIPEDKRLLLPYRHPQQAGARSVPPCTAFDQPARISSTSALSTSVMNGMPLMSAASCVKQAMSSREICSKENFLAPHMSWRRPCASRS
jgi:hypothetical protein